MLKINVYCMLSEAPIGNSITFFPVASWKVKVTGILPPSLVKSGSTPNTKEKKS
jgi:hypothetical protein